MAQNVRIVGTQSNGKLKEIPVTAEGHIEVEVHGPRLPFGSLHVESMRPVFQVDGVHGIPADQLIQTTGRAIAGANSASITNSNNLLKCSTGTTSYSFATLQSKRRLRYRPGQGVIERFTGIWSEPTANSYLLLGGGTAESGVYFGYSGTTFGILHVTGGVREIRTLTITTASTSVLDIQITLNGTAYAVTGITASASTLRTAYEIAQNTFAGWTATAVGSTVVFLNNSAGPKNDPGTYSIAQAGAITPTAGTFATTLAGVTSTDTFIPQTTWNGDKLDGTGPSGITLDPQTGNVFQIDIQYLGFGCITFKVETMDSGNNPTWTVAHVLDWPNNYSSVSLSQPAFPFNMIAYSLGSTTNIWVATASFAGFIEGEKHLTGPRMAYVRETNGFVGSSASTYYPLFTIKNNLTFRGRANQSVVNLLEVSGAHDDATPISYYLLKNATLVGTPNFTSYATESSTVWDTAATSCTISSNDQLVYSLQTGQAAGDSHPFLFEEITIQPGDSLTLAARAVTGTATYVNGSLNTREDH